MQPELSVSRTWLFLLTASEIPDPTTQPPPIHQTREEDRGTHLALPSEPDSERNPRDLARVCESWYPVSKADDGQKQKTLTSTTNEKGGWLPPEYIKVHRGRGFGLWK
ncbi:hypothetical protein ABKN59_011664 [Abortiporus biennis]